MCDSDNLAVSCSTRLTRYNVYTYDFILTTDIYLTTKTDISCIGYIRHHLNLGARSYSVIPHVLDNFPSFFFRQKNIFAAETLQCMQNSLNNYFLLKLVSKALSCFLPDMKNPNIYVNQSNLFIMKLYKCYLLHLKKFFRKRLRYSWTNLCFCLIVSRVFPTDSHGHQARTMSCFVQS